MLNLTKSIKHIKTESQVILIYRQDPLPYHGIGSRTELYRRYLEDESNLVDHLICPKPKLPLFNHVDYHVIPQESSAKRKLKSKIFNNYDGLEQLARLVEPDKKYILLVVDDTGLIFQLNKLFKLRKLKKDQFKVVFSYHGYELQFNSSQQLQFTNTIDHFIFLTQASYLKNKENFNAFPASVSVLHNGIPNEIFKIEQASKTDKFKEYLGLNNEDVVFMWCSQDRPKKGIELTLNLWRKVKLKYKQAKLMIVGIDRKIEMDGIVNVGKVPNAELAKYYQLADVYLFPTLWKEGFGLTLVEALKCGCYCIASNYGGVPEVLDYGKYGKIIERPHFIEDWLQAVDEYFSSPITFEMLPLNKYSTESWNLEMNRIVENLKDSF